MPPFPRAHAIAALATLLAGAAHAQDVAAGQTVFRQTCAICHDIAAGSNRIGPSLSGVVGRSSGTVPGYAYSAANKADGLVWDAATLDRYLVDPHKVVPGTKMAYPGLKDAQKRADLIAYLATLK